ncbi:phage holin family protein [Paenibacillus ginsengihumi]|uniref:phage holin family protein n=1 Tax=Paenibacillus ginsengihumi TaxID=431596 RepID=UPI00037A8B2A|nr:phage holin family protein [Paenibacillus ginsengihumi]
MERWYLLVKWGVAAFSSATTYFFGGWSAILNALLIFVVIDYFTGMAAAGAAGELRSTKGLIGIARKVFIFAMVAAGHLVDRVLGDAHLFRDAIAYFYIANELLSIIENGGKLGAPIPPIVKQAVEVLRGRGEPK